MVNSETIPMLCNELPGGLAGVILGAILDQDDRTRNLGEQVEEKGLIGFAGESFFKTLIDELPTEELDGAEDFVTFSLAGGFDQWLTADEGPGVGKRSPERKADLIAEI